MTRSEEHEHSVSVPVWLAVIGGLCVAAGAVVVWQQWCVSSAFDYPKILHRTLSLAFASLAAILDLLIPVHYAFNEEHSLIFSCRILIAFVTFFGVVCSYHFAMETVNALYKNHMSPTQRSRKSSDHERDQSEKKNVNFTEQGAPPWFRKFWRYSTLLHLLCLSFAWLIAFSLNNKSTLPIFAYYCLQNFHLGCGALMVLIAVWQVRKHVSEILEKAVRLQQSRARSKNNNNNTINQSNPAMNSKGGRLIRSEKESSLNSSNQDNTATQNSSNAATMTSNNKSSGIKNLQKAQTKLNLILIVVFVLGSTALLGFANDIVGISSFSSNSRKNTMYSSPYPDIIDYLIHIVFDSLAIVILVIWSYTPRRFFDRLKKNPRAARVKAAMDAGAAQQKNDDPNQNQNGVKNAVNRQTIVDDENTVRLDCDGFEVTEEDMVLDSVCFIFCPGFMPDHLTKEMKQRQRIFEYGSAAAEEMEAKSDERDLKAAQGNKGRPLKDEKRATGFGGLNLPQRTNEIELTPSQRYSATIERPHDLDRKTSTTPVFSTYTQGVGALVYAVAGRLPSHSSSRLNVRPPDPRENTITQAPSTVGGKRTGLMRGSPGSDATLKDGRMVHVKTESFVTGADDSEFEQQSHAGAVNVLVLTIENVLIHRIEEWKLLARRLSPNAEHYGAGYSRTIADDMDELTQAYLESLFGGLEQLKDYQLWFDQLIRAKNKAVKAQRIAAEKCGSIEVNTAQITIAVSMGDDRGSAALKSADDSDDDAGDGDGDPDFLRFGSAESRRSDDSSAMDDAIESEGTPEKEEDQIIREESKGHSLRIVVISDYMVCELVSAILERSGLLEFVSDVIGTDHDLRVDPASDIAVSNHSLLLKLMSQSGVLHSEILVVDSNKIAVKQINDLNLCRTFELQMTGFMSAEEMSDIVSLVSAV